MCQTDVLARPLGTAFISRARASRRSRLQVARDQPLLRVIVLPFELLTRYRWHIPGTPRCENTSHCVNAAHTFA
jgi:hypothetical protein